MLQARQSILGLSASTPALTTRHATRRPIDIARCLSTVSIAQLLFGGEPLQGDVTVNGHVRSVRKQRKVAFIHLLDGTTGVPLQAVATPDQAKELSTGVAVTVQGTWQQSLGGQQSKELQVKQLQIRGEHDQAAYPLQKKYHSPEFLRTLPHLRARIERNALLLRLRSQLIREVSSFFHDHDFVQTHTPIVTSSDCEGAGEVFGVRARGDQHPSKEQKIEATAGKDAADKYNDLFFRQQKYLTVSAQLHLEALAQGLGKVWTLSPTFRAEHSDTTRHLSEFYMLEAEISFTEKLSDVMNLVENLLRTTVNNLRATPVGNELLTTAAEPGSAGDAEFPSDKGDTALVQRWDALTASSTPWPRVTYQEALHVLCNAARDNTISFEHDPNEGFQAEHERFLVQNIGENGPVFVTDYPAAQKPFYMAPSPQHISTSVPTVACFDLLVPDVCELVGGSVREHRYQSLREAMAARGFLKKSDTADGDAGEAENELQWYLDLRRFGSVPHAGFGLGFDRLLSYLSGTQNIRDVVAFPRWYGRCDC